MFLADAPPPRPTVTELIVASLTVTKLPLTVVVLPEVPKAKFLALPVPAF